MVYGAMDDDFVTCSVIAGEDTAFAKILRKEVPAQFVHEDDQCIAFHDEDPQAPTHVIVIPRKAIQQISKAENCDKQLLGHMMLVARNVAEQLCLDCGFRLVINDGVHGTQTVPHMCIHILGGRQMNWPPG